MSHQEIIKDLKNILGIFAYEYGTDSQSYRELEKLVSHLDVQGKEVEEDEDVQIGRIDLEHTEQEEVKEEGVVEVAESKNSQQSRYNKKQKRG